MDGRGRTRRDGKMSDIALSYNGQEVVESHDCPHPKDTWCVNDDDGFWEKTVLMKRK